MTTATKLGAYTLGLAVLFGGAIGLGRLAGPVTGAAEPYDAMADNPTMAGTGHGGHGQHPSAAGTKLPRGLQVAERGYRLVPQTTVLDPGARHDFRFTVTGPDGRPVTGFTPTHDKKLHFIVARRDLSGFQHLHPVQVGGGVWSVPLTLPAAGVYRAFADFQPEGVEEPLTLGMDLFAPGDFGPEPLPKVSRTATVDGYTVTLAGELAAGRSNQLVLTVRKDGRPVTDLQPYLAAYGHLVALRAGDLAYLHVHPDGEPGDGKTTPGPNVVFHVEVPSPGAYRLYLDFQHQGRVHTAEFTAIATGAGGGTTPPAQAHDAGPSSTHAHGTGR
jgi:hypothetical protein